MAALVDFIVPGLPIAQPRQQHRIAGGKGGPQFVQNYVPSDHPVVAFKAACQLSARMAYKGPPFRPNPGLKLKLIFVFPRTEAQKWKKRPQVRIPKIGLKDADNLAKAVMDALNKQLWVDDKEITKLVVEKWVAAGDEQTHTRVIVSHWGAPPALFGN